MVLSKRIDPTQLKAAVEQSLQHLTAAFVVIEPFLEVLTETQRKEVPRTRKGFLEAGRKLASSLADHPKVAAAADYDPQNARECLDNVEGLHALSIKIDEFQQRLADSRLVWLSFAWNPSLTVYSVAKALAPRKGALRTIVQTLAPIFAKNGRSANKEKTEGKNGRSTNKANAKESQTRTPEGTADSPTDQ